MAPGEGAGRVEDMFGDLHFDRREEEPVQGLAIRWLRADTRHICIYVFFESNRTENLHILNNFCKTLRFVMN
jgi:hypothetical protein